MVDYVTPDLCDAYPDVRVISPMFRNYGGRKSFGGQVVTVKCFEDNSRVKELLATPGKGKVLVVDGGGSLRCALLGDLIGASAVKHEKSTKQTKRGNKAKKKKKEKE